MVVSTIWRALCSYVNQSLEATYAPTNHMPLGSSFTSRNPAQPALKEPSERADGTDTKPQTTSKVHARRVVLILGTVRKVNTAIQGQSAKRRRSIGVSKRFNRFQQVYQTMTAHLRLPYRNPIEWFRPSLTKPPPPRTGEVCVVGGTRWQRGYASQARHTGTRLRRDSWISLVSLHLIQ